MIGRLGREQRRHLGDLIAPRSPRSCERTETVPLLLLALADDEHARDLRQLGVADLAPDRLRALVDPTRGPRRRRARRRLGAA